MINSPTVLAALAPAPPSPTAGGTWPRLPRRGVKRPRGLWKARRRLDTPPSHSSQHQLLQTTASSSRRGSDTDREEEDEREIIEASGSGEGRERWEAGEDDEEDGHGAGDEDEDEQDDMSQDSGSSKRQRRDSRSGSCGSAELLWAAVYANPKSPSPTWKWSADADALDAPDAAGAGSAATDADADADADARSRPASGRGARAGGAVPAISDDAVRGQAALISNMVTTSVAERAPRAKETFEYNDWEEIKETLTRASALCDRACRFFLRTLSPYPVLSPGSPISSRSSHDHHVCVLNPNRRRPNGCYTSPTGGHPRMSSFPCAIP
jgi:hypothetical protein